MGSLLAAPRVPSFVLSNPSTSTEQAIAGTAGQGNNSTATAGSSVTGPKLSTDADNTASSDSAGSTGTNTTQNASDSNLLLRQNRGTNSTILTSLRGLLDETETLGAKKTLLGQ